MNNIKVLDCTLRDGGYCNHWEFGLENTKKIICGLVEANIDIIECGFLTNKVSYNPDITRFTSLQEIQNVIPEDREGKLFVVMMNYGEYDIDSLPVCDHTSIDGIRIAFHKKNLKESIEDCKRIQEKGYLVFIQAMVSLSYSDEEFLDLISRVNDFEPYSFYIVDSFGMMKGKDLTRLFYMVEHNLKDSILIGFHSHNNMQLAYSNAQILVGMQTTRKLIIDSSVYGMGRGAGNLNTELFVEYLNENLGKKYSLRPLLSIIDEILNGFYQINYWGYSLPNYISAVHNAHPNYVGYLDDKKTLTIENMNDIFSMMDEEKKVSYDKNYIEHLYIRYLEMNKAQGIHKSDLEGRLSGSTVLLIGPGKSSEEYNSLIKAEAYKKAMLSISINFEYKHLNTNYIFLSNLRRFRELDTSLRKKCIVTSNIPADGTYCQIPYKDLLNDIEAVRDNAGLMAIKFLIQFGVRKVIIAGFDGYSHDLLDNFARRDMMFITKKAVIDAINEGMRETLNQYKKEIELEFLTKPRFFEL